MLKIRQGLDGSLWIPRHDSATEAYLDSLYRRVKGKLMWVCKLPSLLGHYKDTYKKFPCYIVGKGPSLDNLKASHFEKKGPVIAINEAIHKVESLNITNPLHVIQMDSLLLETCKPKNETTVMFLSPRCGSLYMHGVNKAVIDPRSFGLEDNVISALMAIMLARHMGCSRFIFISFDSSVNGNNEYAKCVGYPATRAGSPLRFGKHKQQILEATQGLNVEWIIPKEIGYSKSVKI